MIILLEATAIASAEVKDGDTLTSADFVNSKLDVGIAETTTSKNPQKVKFDGDLIVSEGMEVGAYTEGKLMTSFSGTSGSDHSNSLEVTGTVNISGSGKVILGGQTHSNSYMGLYASDVTVAGSDSNNKSAPNLSATMAYIDNLTVKSGAVVLRSNDDATGGYNGYENGDGSKQTMIKKSITVEGGSLYIGKNNGQKPTEYNNHYLNAIGSNNGAATITQKNGYIEVNGKTRVEDGLIINQTGGEMVFANETSGRAMIVFDGAKANMITQGGDADTKMTLGQMGVITSSYVSGKGFVYSGSGNGQVNISQTGQGEINLAKGVTFKTKDASTASTITQSGGGKINLSGDFSSAIFNISQSKGAINLNSGASMVSNTLTVNTAATLNISGTLTVNTDLKFNIDTPDQEGAAIVLNGGNIDVANLANTVEFNLSDAVITDMMTDAMAFTAETGEELYTYTIDLVSGLNATDVAEFQTLMDSGKLEWILELPTVYGGTVTMTELVDSGLQWSESGNTLQLQTTWKSVPEPTTATLSVLALAALATRRRRRR